MARRTKRERMAARLLLKVYEAEEEPRGLAESVGLSLGELAEWAAERETVAALHGLRRLADMQTQLILSRYRQTAGAKLVALANQEEDDELSRKACVDLLKLDVAPEPPGRRAAPAQAAEAEGGRHAAEEVINEGRVLRALEELGRGGDS